MPAVLAPALRLLVRVAFAAVAFAVLLAAVITAGAVTRVVWGAVTAGACQVVSSEPAACTPERIDR